MFPNNVTTLKKNKRTARGISSVLPKSAGGEQNDTSHAITRRDMAVKSSILALTVFLLIFLVSPHTITHITRINRDAISAISGTTMIIMLVSYLVSLYLHRFKPHILKDNSKIALLSSILITNFALIRLAIVADDAFSSYLGIGIDSFSYAIPYAAGTMLVSMLFDIDIGVIFSLLTSLFVGILIDSGYSHPLVALTGGLIATFRLHQYRRRSDILRSGAVIGVINILTILPIDTINHSILSMDGVYDLLMGFLGGALAAVTVSVLLPVFEALFKVTSNIRLLELADPNHPLLSQMVIYAPGTYQHSHLVANLSEEAAEAVEANALLARIGAYFHDIGKMKKAEYYIENQQISSGGNRHDKLTPNMSSLVLASHVKDGIELAREYGLVPRIIDFIREHHGNSLITYFYNKAKDQQVGGDSAINEEDFRYPGPRPTSKETAIVMLADSIEAASRNLDDPTPSSLKGLVHRIINEKFIDGQLDESDLSLKDLNKISESFLRILIGIFHFRVDYPDKNDKKDKGEGEDIDADIGTD